MLAHKQSAAAQAAELFSATVQGVLDEYFIVNGPDGPLPAKKAVSCLVAPEPGDLALCSAEQNFAAQRRAVHILAVLERAEPSKPLDLAFPGDVRIVAQQGAVTLAAAERIELPSPEIEAHAGRATLETQECALSGASLLARFKTIGCVAQSCEQIFRDFTQRLKSCFRVVEGHEESQAGSARQLVEKTLTVQCKNSVHTAEETVKIDGESIHLA